MKFEIPKETLQSIVDYLSTKPYNESAGLINMVQQTVTKVVGEPIIEEQEEKPKKEKSVKLNPIKQNNE